MAVRHPTFRSAIGIESLLWLLDVAGLSHAEARALVRDRAQALLQAALAPPSAD